LPASIFALLLLPLRPVLHLRQRCGTEGLAVHRQRREPVEQGIVLRGRRSGGSRPWRLTRASISSSSTPSVRKCLATLSFRNPNAAQRQELPLNDDITPLRFRGRAIQ
ncbi:hypothetical protein MUK42_13621, partial [Musa troglodytarum]